MIEERKYKNMKDIKRPAWENFMSQMDFESDNSNFKIDFKVLSKKYGQAYIEFCKSMWISNENSYTNEEFCKVNGNMPIGFFNKVIKGLI